jgi:hypothetical protein
VIPETGTDVISGVFRFYSLRDVRRFLKELLDTYQRDYDKSSNTIGSLLRSDEGKAMEIIRSKGWSKVGGLFVNMADSEKGAMEVVFQIVEEMKPRIAKTEAVLRSFDTVEGLPIPEEATFLLYLRSGVPERLIVDTVETKPQKFLLNARFKTE